VFLAASHALQLILAVLAVCPSTSLAMGIVGIIDMVDDYTGFQNYIDCSIIHLLIRIMQENSNL